MDLTLAALAGSAALHHLISAALCRKPVTLSKDGSTLQAVGHVTSLRLHPVKSMRGLAVDALYCGMNGVSTVDGMLYDR